MYDKNNIFATILRGEAECKKVYEDKNVLAFYDLHPSAPIHVLVVPKGEYKSFDDFASNSQNVADFFKAVQKIATKLELIKSGYRIVTNHGDDAGQIVPHFHVHILGGKKLDKLA